ncbi:MAG: insulinase family protein [Desulfovibrionaceae bacterium]|nr:insulinase family protein [Desulfovibrionaceae bacterium]
MVRTLLSLVAALLLAAGCQTTHMKQPSAEQKLPAAPLPSLSKDAGGETHVVTLQNGLRILIKEDDRFPLASVKLWVHAGSGYETPDIAGISHLLEHMVFKGTEKRAMGEVAMDIESVGGNLNAGTSFDYTVFYVDVPDDQWRLGLDTITDMAFHPLIDAGELESEKKVVLEELERGEDTPSRKLFKTLQSMIWKGTSYEWPVIGYRETVQGITRAGMKKYIADHYQPQSMLLTVVGKVNPDEVLAEAERILGSLENTVPLTPPRMIEIPRVGQGPQVVKMEGKWNKVYLAAAFPIPGGGSVENTGLEVLSQIMGGDDTSRLYRTFKYDKQLVDDISATTIPLERGGIFYISATLDADKVDAFWAELNAELAAFSPLDFTDQELDRAKLNLESSLFLSKETLSGLASKLGYLEFFENGEQAEKNYLHDLKEVTREEMDRLYDKYVRPDQLAVAVLVPEGNGVDESRLADITRSSWPAKDAEQAKAATAQAAAPEEIALPGGSKLVLLPDATLPYTAMSLYWIGGDGELTPDQQGLAALTAAALTRGTMRMSATEVQDFLSDHAATLGSTSGRNVFALETKFPTRFTDDLLPLVNEILTTPAFDKNEISRAKQDQIASIKRREDQPLGLAFRHLFPFLYKTGPYALMRQGTPEGVEGFTTSDIIRFWNRQSMQPFTLAVCGQFDRQAIEAFAANVARTLTAPVSRYEFVTPKWGDERELDLKLADRNQSHILMTFPVTGKNDLDASAELSMLNAILSGQSGLLFRDLRDKQGLAYTVTSMLWQSRNTGFITLYIGTSPDTVDQSLAGFRKVLGELAATPLPEEELSRARNILTGEYYQTHQSLISRSRQAASLVTRGFPRDYDDQLLERAKSVTPEELQNLVKQYLTPDKAYILTVTP